MVHKEKQEIKVKAEDFAQQLDLDVLRLSRLESVELQKDPEAGP